MRTTPWIVLVLMSGLACAPLAGHGLPKRAEAKIRARFEKADADHDGRLTREEARSGMPKVYAHFDAIDSDHKGYLTVEGILDFARSHASE